MSRAPDDPLARYWPRYCEENVWHACDAMAGDSRDVLAVVIANRSGRVAVFRQRAARGRPGEAIAWDYHVVLAVRADTGWTVVDPDSTLPCPCAADVYLAESFPALPEPLARYRPLFRVVDAATYRARFASDRRHMRDGRGGWWSEPPPWPPIGAGHVLDRLIDMDDPFVGERADLEGLRRRLDVSPRPPPREGSTR